MWILFFIAALLVALMLYLPGYALLAHAPLDRITALAFAPIVSIAAYSATAIITTALGISCPAFFILLPTAIISVTVYGTQKWLDLRNRSHMNPRTSDCHEANPSYAPAHAKTSTSSFKERYRWDSKSFGLLALYLGVGIIFVFIYYVLPLNGPGASIQTYDNVFHYNVIQSFDDTQLWNVLFPSAQQGVVPAQASLIYAPAFYPAAWHLICGLIMNILSIPTAVAVNATTLVFIAPVFGWGMLALLRFLFPNKDNVVIAGSLAVYAASAFPWSLIQYWSLYPNAISFLCLPMTIPVAFQLFEPHHSVKQRILYCLLAIIAVFTITVIQPSTIFCALVFAIPYFAHRTYQAACKHWHRKTIGSILSGLTVVAFAGLWVACFHLPFLNSLVSFFWVSISSLPNAVEQAVLFGFYDLAPNPILTVLCVTGILGILLKDRSHSWIIVPYFISILIYSIAASGDDTLFKHLISGFWYTDYHRIAAFCVIFALPLVAYGAGFIAYLLLLPFKTPQSRTQILFNACIAVLMLFVLITPQWPFSPNSFTSMGAMQNAATANFHDDPAPYDLGEMAFVEEAKALIGQDALVINQPYDGSMWAYGLNNLNTYYRERYGYEAINEWPTRNSIIIRNYLANMESNPSVRQAVKETGAQYVLKLDNPKDINPVTALYKDFSNELWEGINNINDSTEGFEVVLAEGDMRLYKIQA